MKKSTRRVIAQETLDSIETGYYHNKEGHPISFAKMQAAAEQGAVLYTPEDLDDLLAALPPSDAPFGETRFEVWSSTTLDAVRKLYEEGETSIFCLNFASAKNPGGGFLGGAQAQEESIARATGLYPCLLKGKKYYEYHRKQRTCLYSDHMIYAPEVPIIKDEDGNPLDTPVPVGILTSPAVNAGVVRRNEPKRVHLIPEVMKRRIAKMLTVAAEHGHETLVLGAWGCGVFQNDPEDMAKWHREAFDGLFKDRFRRVIFAVYARDERFIRPIQELFS
jgi:uncharacterized protein (TIGR02452 family)